MASRYSISVQFKAIDQLTSPIRRMEGNVVRSAARMERSINALSRATGGFTRSIRNAGRATVRFGVIGLGLLGASIGWVTKQFSKIEDAEASFQPMLGSAEQAKKTVEELNQLAVKTPFRFEQLAASSRILLSMQAASAKSLVPTLRMLGDVAGGNADRLNRISLVYGQVISAGKANSRDMLQFIDAGVPVKAMLADLLNTDIQGVTDLTKKGLITDKMVNQSLKNATSIVNGVEGMFFDAMELMSLTTTGLTNQLINNTELAGASIGAAISEPLKEILVEANLVAQEFRAWAEQEENMKKIREEFEKFKDTLRAIGGFIRDNWKWMLKLVAAIIALVIVTKSFVAVLALINFAVQIGPIGKVIIIIYALIAAIAALWVWWDQIYERNPLLANSLKYLAGTALILSGAFIFLRLTINTLKIVILALGKVIAGIRWLYYSWIALQTKLNVALSANPIGLIIIAIAALIAVLIALYVYWEDLVRIFSESTWGKTVIGVFKTWVGWIYAALNGLKQLGQWLGIIDSAEVKIDENLGRKNKEGEAFNPANGSSDVPAVVSQNERLSETLSTQINESKSTATIDINDNTQDRVQVTRTGAADGILLGASGSFL